jgi:hypothetical protein
LMILRVWLRVADNHFGGAAVCGHEIRATSGSNRP